MVNTPGTVNDQITDSVSQTVTLTTGLAATQGMGLLEVVAAETFGMTMHNAVSAQQNAQITANASIATTCAKMLGAQPLPPPTPSTPAPPPFMPLTTNDPTGEPTDLINTAGELANAALRELEKRGGKDKQVEDAIQKLVDTLKASEKSTPADATTAETGNDDKDQGKANDHKDVNSQ